VNVPYFEGSVLGDQAAILWLGQVSRTSNHADVRVGYNEDGLELTLHIFDRRLWYDTTPAAGDLDAWDAVTLYLHLDGNDGDMPTPRSHRFVAQLNW
jgi:hypothetical protein